VGDFRWVEEALVGFEVEDVLVRWDWRVAAGVMVEVSWRSHPRLGMDVGLGSLVAVAGLGWGDVEGNEVLGRVDRKVGQRSRSRMGDGRIRLEELALRRLGRDVAEGRMHNRVGERLHEDSQEVGGVAWCMVRSQPWEIE
jgi:hypothetical protein